jgi:CRISPR/Cas system-associated exonuclease Cas4 (RecB family)
MGEKMSFLIGVGLIVIAGIVIYGIVAGNNLQKKYFIDGYRILFHEKGLEITEPFPMRGKPDIVFEHIETGELLTGELKVRTTSRIYRSDRVQVSAGRMLVAGNFPNKQVSSKGVMLLHTEGITNKVDVETLSSAEMVSMYERFVGLVKGNIKPKGAENPHYCEDCAFVKDCKVRSS